MIIAAKVLLKLGAKNILIKGGHLKSGKMKDIFVNRNEVAIFEKHGAEVVAVWQRLDDPNTLVWMLAYRDRAHRSQVWADFAADPAWHALRAKYEVPLSIEAYMMSTTDYSNLK